MLQTILSSNNNNKNTASSNVGAVNAAQSAASNTMRLLSQLLTSPQVKFQQNISSDFLLKHHHAEIDENINCDYKPKKQRVKLNPIPIPIPAPSSPESDHEFNNQNGYNSNGKFQAHLFVYLSIICFFSERQTKLVILA